MKRTTFGSLWWPVLSGILLALVTPFFGLWFLAPVALVPFGMFLESGPSRWKLVFATLLVSFPFCLFAGEPLFRLAGTWWAVGGENQHFVDVIMYPAGILGIVFVATVSYLIPVFVYRSIRQSFLAPSLVFGATWAVVEFVRSAVLFAGYSWGVLGYALIDSLYLKHSAALFGVYILSFISAALGIWGGRFLVIVLSEEGAILARMKRVCFGKKNAHDTLAVCLVFLCMLYFGVVREFIGPNTIVPTRVAVIGSNVRTTESIGEGSYRTYRKLFRDAIAANAAVVVAPENVFPYFIVDEDTGRLFARSEVYLPNTAELYEDFLSISREAPAVTIALPLHTQLGGLRYNSILLYRGGEIVSVYHKKKPVPFTEYSPFGFTLPLYETIAKGAEQQDFRMGDMQLGAYICSEVGITPFRLDATRLIIAPSNDSALLSDTIGPLQHQFARMRALEAGAFMLRSSKGGISSIINPHGVALATMQDENGLMILDIK